jgi:hypothetical protein
MEERLEICPSSCTVTVNSTPVNFAGCNGIYHRENQYFFSDMEANESKCERTVTPRRIEVTASSHTTPLVEGGPISEYVKVLERKILWYVDPLLGNFNKTSNY